ncbi:HAMP domain-containing protein [Paraburkholderia sp. CNPSo 3155]|uniref:histidine kinase n=1 Tax=Paraburkholderia atlantica TaxID=2654982 RepID=D5WLN9_PARAM|nr:ATP-binding protein [Paraburkholderia atlantica]ADG20135.1 integral membrane sensor signal transduction histidine kinase [Paraburkholderia atlantica]MBB5427102.1 signal transduction histidine kinase [Paraburkholderia atlantica]MBB5508840.1 signal transduction histidine kinase [Paraburkholderia atlantica]MPW07887.1 HAMP domain-containing protein [Paraburkholderia atlantica]
MNASASPSLLRWPHWPRTLFARLAVILFIGLALAQALSFWLTMTERDQTMTGIMMGYIEREVASSVALLDHLPPDERAQWLPRLARRSYEFVLGPGVSGTPVDASLSARVAQSIGDGIGTRYPLTVNAVPGDHERLQVHLKLSDGTPLTIDLRPMPGAPLSRWLPLVLTLQLLVLAACCWLAVRLATRPLNQLAVAADTLGPDLKAERLPEAGPSEVARAARAFNAMQDRIATYMTERMQILAAISHDLQTPITRMRLRVDTLDDDSEAAKLRQDLQEMEALVKEGVTYARTMHGTTEVPRRIDPDALFDSLVCDYVDAGQQVSLQGQFGQSLTMRPQALKRIVGNLVDNALRYAGAAQIDIGALHDGEATVSVLDRGPGIPAESLETVFEPFVRLEGSRNRQTGGTGLGLAIARQLALAMDATLTLHNRVGGGLEARLTLRKLRES